MTVSLEDIQEIFRNLLSGNITRDEADRWAWKRMEAYDYKTLEFLPENNEDTIWDALTYLNGIDLKHSKDGDYLDGMEHIQEMFEMKWK